MTLPHLKSLLLRYSKSLLVEILILFCALPGILWLWSLKQSVGERRHYKNINLGRSKNLVVSHSSSCHRPGRKSYLLSLNLYPRE